ncbi:helicase-related protein [Promethearchaeum syntrophicum]|uniref:Helicase-related protein n=1 Tax=Promethearchaeum syntrophicum TaxID=2594042 RepID=A0A5B9DES3_9ARCH|nr:helicase-related protein [Candidatus Prometheoarchaeum syntrophicum]QEE17283.1 putative ATP-dependent RNA helicase [Candidatus Prometheoarchaeum syntrophicum]
MFLFYPEICQYCKTSIDISSKGICPNLKCRSHSFFIGNLVVLRNNPGLGIGRIIDVLEKLPNKKNKDISNIQLDKYLVQFQAFHEKIIFRNDLLHYIFDIGKKIRYSSDIGTILSYNLDKSDGIVRYEILSSSGLKMRLEETQILSEYQSPIDEFLKGNIDSQNQFLLRFWAFQASDLYESNILKIITNSRLSLLPHQISVAHSLLELGYARYILADEVGLGKTIEAGIYLKEMIARNLASRILIITPASITGQWEFEMKNKFNLHFTRLNSALLKKLKINYNSGNLQHIKSSKEYSLLTVSLQYARLNQCYSILTQMEWDIVIFDEAHHLRRYLTNQKTGQYRTTLAYELAEKLSEKSKSLLLLTATPIQLHSFDLFSLIQLLNPYEFSNYESFEIERKKIPLLNTIVKNLRNFTRINTYERNALKYQISSFNINIDSNGFDQTLRFPHHREALIQKLENQHFLSKFIIRNRRRIVFPDNPVRRIPHVIEVELTQEELDVYNRIHLYLAKVYSQNYESGPAGLGFVMVILQKLLTSSVPAILKSMKKRIKYLEENQDLLLKLQDDYKKSLEFTDEDSSLDYAWGLEELDLEDRIIVKNRQRKMIPKKETNLNIKTHIQILREFVKDLENLQYDSKAENLVEIIQEIMDDAPDEKIIIFTQFKATLFYLTRLLEKKGYKVFQFHGDLDEKQKNQSVSSFKQEGSILLSTEIGGEGRNFQFCHIIVNYDLPWNPMRLEQRIGRLDRFGQKKNVLIYNFFIKDTVESSIVTAILNRIKLFEESIGALEPILGKLERQITNLVLKDNEIPRKFRIDETISKTSNKIHEIYDKLEDLILDKRSFQYDYISKDINNPDLLSGIDIFSFINRFSNYMKKNQLIPNKYEKLPIELAIKNNPRTKGVWNINLSEKYRKCMKAEDTRYQGVFNIDLAKDQEEYDFYALGHPLIMNLIDWCKKDNFGGSASLLFLDIKKLASYFMNPYLVRLKAGEVPIVQKLLRNETGLNLFLFEIKFLGIIIEKIVIPVFISDEFDLLPSLSDFISRPHNFNEVISENQNYAHAKQDFHISEDFLKKCYDISIKSTKNWIQKRTQELTKLNRDSYFQKRKRIIKSAEQKKNFSEVQLQKIEQKLRAKKLKMPTERQIDNLEKISDTSRKKKRMENFNKIKKEVQYLENERERWERNLENLEFDLPEQLKRLKKYKQLLINAECISYARIILK